MSTVVALLRSDVITVNSLFINNFDLCESDAPPCDQKLTNSPLMNMEPSLKIAFGQKKVRMVTVRVMP